MLIRAILLAVAALTVVGAGFSQSQPVVVKHSHTDLLRFEAFLNLTTNKDAAVASQNGKQAAFGKTFGLTSELSNLIASDNLECLSRIGPINADIRASVAEFRARFTGGIVKAGQDMSPPARTHTLQMNKDLILSECLSIVGNHFSEASRVAAIHAILYPGGQE